MAWEWSHAPEAYTAARTNLENVEPSELRVIWAEWKAAIPRQFGEHELDTDRYELALLDAGPLGPVRLASDIWERAAEYATCDNGGFNAHVCPFGCHTVPFDVDTEEVS